MKSGPALFLQAATVLVGIGVLVFMLWEPHIEGRNAHATTFEIYFKDPFLAYVYVGSTPFFIALYRAFGLFGHVRKNGAFSQVTVDALRAIKRCAIALIGFVAVGGVFILMFGDKDDRPAGVFMTFLFTIASSVIAIAAAMFAAEIAKCLEAVRRRPGLSLMRRPFTTAATPSDRLGWGRRAFGGRKMRGHEVFTAKDLPNDPTVTCSFVHIPQYWKSGRNKYIGHENIPRLRPAIDRRNPPRVENTVVRRRHECGRQRHQGGGKRNSDLKPGNDRIHQRHGVVHGGQGALPLWDACGRCLGCPGEFHRSKTEARTPVKPAPAVANQSRQSPAPILNANEREQGAKPREFAPHSR